MTGFLAGGPSALWHIDFYDKIKYYGIVIMDLVGT